MSKHWLTFVTVIAVVSGATFLGWIRCDWSHVTRSGAVVVTAGILLEYWKLLQTTSVDETPFWGTQSAHDATRVAIVVVCLGTLIQGYGDWVASSILSHNPRCSL